MSQEATPQQVVPKQRAQQPAHQSAQQQGAPKGLLQQMEELMAALNADLSQLDADLQSTAARPPATAGADADGTAGSGGTDGTDS